MKHVLMNSFTHFSKLRIILILILFLIISACSPEQPSSVPQNLYTGTPAFPSDTTAGQKPIQNESVPASPTPENRIIVPGGTPTFTYKVINKYPHQTDAWTQGLVFHDGILIESTGLRGRSKIQKFDLDSGLTLQTYLIPDHLFGEGITVLNGDLIHLTWQSHTGYVYSPDTFQIKQIFMYPFEGWGITHNNEYLIISDGSSILHFFNPDSYLETYTIEVTSEDQPINNLNELEYINGEIYANIWKKDLIARIDPVSGQVIGWINLQGLVDIENYLDPIDVLNGIAYDPDSDRLLVTGKLWPHLYEIQLIQTSLED
jgi:glutaminyl-peptide cyclotransferase